MPVENLPLWTKLPNWRETISERLEWLSPVLSSPTGAEQRFSERRTPRRSFEATFTFATTERSWMDNAIGAAGASRWYAPLFHDVGRTTATSPSGGDTIYVETTGREFRVGGFVMLWRDIWTASVHEITGIAAGSLTVTPDLALTWEPGTLCQPCDVFRIEAQAAQRRTDAVAEMRARFSLDGPSPFAAAMPLTAYAGLPVLLTPPNESGDLTTEYRRLLSEFGTERTRRFVVDTADRSFTIQQHRWVLVGRSEQDELRSMFHALRGRRGSLWLPTFAADFDLVQPAAADASGITVRRAGFWRFGGPRFNREHILILLRDGTTIMRRITDALEVGNTEVLTLDAALGTAITPNSVQRISFLARCRLEQDGIEFVHYTDKSGAATVAATFRTAGDYRAATPYLPTPFLNPAQNEIPCGFPVEWDFSGSIFGTSIVGIVSGDTLYAEQTIDDTAGGIHGFSVGGATCRIWFLYTAPDPSPPPPPVVLTPLSVYFHFPLGRPSGALLGRFRRNFGSLAVIDFQTANWLDTTPRVLPPGPESTSGPLSEFSNSFVMTVGSNYYDLMVAPGLWSLDLKLL